jgi:hypothetical protein
MSADREPSTREPPSLFDWVIIAISPALIMLMVGSLVFFLVEVLYRGQYNGRLLYTLFFFVFGAVLIARISIERGYALASVYGLGLGLATFVALQAYVEYPNPAMRAFSSVINITLMALVWWSANKLTWDCTHLDEDRKTSGRGVLAAAGLDASAAADNPNQQREDAAEAELDRKEQKKRRKDPEGFAGWMARWQRYREAQRNKPHTPGVWVVYFSLAALPLFGLGQSLIDPADTERRRFTFLLMAVYVGSGLGLLVTTSLLGLRKYLRERGVKIPTAMTAGWLGLGAILILAFLAIGALLPRPHSETPWFGLERAGKKDRQASQYALVKDGSAGKGEGTAGKKTEAGDGKQSAKGGKEGGNSAEKGKGGGKGQDQGGQQSGNSNGGGQKSDSQAEKGDDENRDQKGPNRKADSKAQQKASNRDQQQQNGGRNAGEVSEPSQDADGEAKDTDGSSEGSSSSQRLTQALESVADFVKWVVWVIVAILVIVGVSIFILKFLAPFTEWARNLLDWLKGLFARKPRERPAVATDTGMEEDIVQRPPPFASFANPFTDGSAKRMSLEELVEYSFAAFDSWAWDRDRGRQLGETPNEFAARIGCVFPALEQPGWRLANLYVRVLYSNTTLPSDAKTILKQFWMQIEQPIFEQTEAEVG